MDTLHDTGSKAKVKVISDVNQDQLYEAQVVHVDYPHLDYADLMVQRFVWFKTILEQHPDLQVAILDGFDIVFQQRPEVLDQTSVNVCEEDVLLTKSKVNFQWLNQVAPADVVRTIMASNPKVVCAGAIWGQARSVVKVCDWIIQHRVDQGTLNWIARTGLVPIVIHPNGRPVWHTGVTYGPVYQRIPGGFIQPKNQGRPVIVHQYERPKHTDPDYVSIRRFIRQRLRRLKIRRLTRQQSQP